MEPLWSPVVATRWQSAANRMGRNLERTSQNRCGRLRPVADRNGKEGVRGSSPREGFRKFLLISFFRRLMRRQKRGAASTERPRAAAVFSYESAKSCC
jgi:hypothetical protein